MHCTQENQSDLPAINEEKRIGALQHYCVLDTVPEAEFDHLAALGAALFGTSIALISFVDRDRQFFKSTVGLPITQTAREFSFCAHAILGEGPFVVLDATLDDRFKANPLVIGQPHIRFYAGAPLRTREGFQLGTFCVMDSKPREGLTVNQLESLERFAKLAVSMLERRLLPALVADADQRMRDANERYTLATQATNDGIWDWQCSKDDFHYSAKMRAILGHPMVGHSANIKDWLDQLHPHDARACAESVRHLQTSSSMTFDGEYRIKHANGTWCWVRNRGTAVRDAEGQLLRLGGAVSDITSGKVADPLTGLHNRSSFTEHLRWRIVSSTKHRRAFALLFIDLDLFKQVNDRFGHRVGDFLLVELSRRMEATLGNEEDSIAARFGGDEFVVLLSDVATQEDALTYANCLQALLQSPVDCGDQQQLVSASIGIVMGTGTSGTAESMVEGADCAMYRAKAKGKAQSIVFSPTMRDTRIPFLGFSPECSAFTTTNEPSMT